MICNMLILNGLSIIIRPGYNKITAIDILNSHIFSVSFQILIQIKKYHWYLAHA